MYSKKNIIGMSLIELMICLVLSMIILSSVYSILLYSLNVLNRQAGIAHLQANTLAMTQLFSQFYKNKKRDNETNYFIDKTDRLNKDGSFIFSLFKKENEHPKEELIDNVDYLQINYDILKDNKVIEMKSFEKVDWNHVLGVSIAYELRDSDSIPAQRKKGFIYVAL